MARNSAGTEFRVQVKPRSKKEGVTVGSQGELIVAVNVPPIEGRANQRVIELLSDHFQIPKSRIRLVRGEKSKSKVFRIED